VAVPHGGFERVQFGEGKGKGCSITDVFHRMRCLTKISVHAHIDLLARDCVQELSEGVLNLPRAFLIAGVPCIVASQWLVDDALTPKIMEAFYGNMKQGEDVASALCHSMRLVKRENERDLQKWGVFNVWGLPTVCLPKDLQASHSDPPDMIC
jgi:hypothetical protein